MHLFTIKYVLTFHILEVLSGEVNQYSVTVSSNSEEPSCSVPEINNGYFEYNQNTTFLAGNTVEIHCENGYRFPGVKHPMLIAHCNQDGTWKDFLQRNISHCERIGSCHVPEMIHGQILSTSTGYMPGDLAPVRCNDGRHYKIKCQNDGTWRNLDGSLYNEYLCSAEKNCSSLPDVINGQYHLIISTKAMLRCNEGYTMTEQDMALLTCIDGDWYGVKGKCVVKKNVSLCQQPEIVPSSYYSLYGGNNIRKGDPFTEGTTVEYACESGYKMYGISRRICINGKWTGVAPKCIPGCSAPPAIAYTNFNFFGQHSADNLRIAEGSYVYYSCENGYKMKTKNMSALKCEGGTWQGIRPVCVKRNKCDQPMDIPHGVWIILSIYPDFRVGSRVGYECHESYKAIGVSEIECLSTGYWSDYAPRCLPSESYCSEPKTIENGFYMCNPNHCDLFRVGTDVHYICAKQYTADPLAVTVMTCQEGGAWSEANPKCNRVNDVIPTTNTLELTSSTLTVVIVTSSCVLGLLFLVIVVVVLQKKRRSLARHGHNAYVPHIHGTQQHYPNYARVTEARIVPALDENDRVALIAFADGVQVVLPTYDEAIRGSSNGANRLQTGGRLHRYNSDSSRSSGRSGSTRGGSDHRSFLSYNTRPATYLRELPAEHQRDHHRNSIITTTSSAMRGGDNLSLAFGSMDTVNISDNTSTTVTLGTYDSGASNPSLSQRAVTGSMASANSNPSLATEDAPLIESIDFCQEVHRSQTASPSIPEEIEEEDDAIVLKD